MKMDEKNYIIFLITFDMNLKEIAEKYNSSVEVCCDTLYNFVLDISNSFYNSEYYKNLKHSVYEMLSYYVRDNGGLEEIYKNYYNIKETRWNNENK